MTPDAIIGLVRTLAGALHGQYGEAVQKAAIEAMARIAAGLCSRACETLSMAGALLMLFADKPLGPPDPSRFPIPASLISFAAWRGINREW